jgi:hypothetical protein
MGANDLSFIIIIFSLLFAVVGVGIRIAHFMSFADPADPSPPKASARKGVIYTFTVGMLPWKKESARLHPVVYLRGASLHIGIFTSIILVVTSLAVDWGSISGRIAFSPFLALGVLAGIAALVARFQDRNLRVISRADDYISLVLVILVLLVGFVWILDGVNRTIFWGVVSATCLYLPWSKVPHVAYFFFSRTVFGIMFGRRGVLKVAKTGH